LGSCGYVEYEQANVERATDGNLPSESWDLIFEVVDLADFVDTGEVMAAIVHQLQSDNTKVQIYALTVTPLLLMADLVVGSASKELQKYASAVRFIFIHGNY